MAAGRARTGSVRNVAGDAPRFRPGAVIFTIRQESIP
jgi:hypothetical protein